MADAVNRPSPVRAAGEYLLFASLAAVASGLAIRWLPIANSDYLRYVVYGAVGLIVIVPTSEWRRAREPAAQRKILLRVVVFLVLALVLEQVILR